MVGGEKEADAEVGELRLPHFARTGHVEAKRFQRVGCPGLGRSGPISVLCDRNIARRHDDRHRGRHIERVVAVAAGAADVDRPFGRRSEEHTSELQSLMRISYVVFCLKKNKTQTKNKYIKYTIRET